MDKKELTLAFFLAALVGIAVCDYRKKRISNKWVLLLGSIGAISFFTMPETGIASRLAGFFAASLPLFLITMIVPGAFGGGDIKLMSAAGLFLGGKKALIALLLGIFFGGGYAGICLLFGIRGRKDRFAFGPFLCMGIVLAYFLGDALL